MQTGIYELALEHMVKGTTSEGGLNGNLGHRAKRPLFKETS